MTWKGDLKALPLSGVTCGWASASASSYLLSLSPSEVFQLPKATGSTGQLLPGNWPLSPTLIIEIIFPNSYYNDGLFYQMPLSAYVPDEYLLPVFFWFWFWFSFLQRLKWSDSLSTRVVGNAPAILNLWDWDVELGTLKVHLDISLRTAHLPAITSRHRAHWSPDVALSPRASLR